MVRRLIWVEEKLCSSHNNPIKINSVRKVLFVYRSSIFTCLFFVYKMLLLCLLLTPLIGILMIASLPYGNTSSLNLKYCKIIALTASIVSLFISFIIFILFNFSDNQFQFVQEYHKIHNFDFYLGIDGISIYFILLTTIIIPVSLLSN